jgi:hypothetical protein
VSVHPTITVPQTPQRKWLVAAIAAVALAGVIAAVLAFTLGGNSQQAPSATPSASTAAQDASRVPSIFSLTPMGLATGVLGTGYALPPAHPLPSVASVLASMDPQTRRYTKAIMALTFKQLAAGAAGHP